MCPNIYPVNLDAIKTMVELLRLIEAFTSKFQKEDKEVLLLISDSDYNDDVEKWYNSWRVKKGFLAYIDVTSSELKVGKGNINWLLSDEENRDVDFESPYYFKKGIIYRLKVKQLIDKTVLKDRMPSYCKNLMVIEVLEEDVQNKELLDVLKEYRTPITISDKTLGEFLLTKGHEFGYFIDTIYEDTLGDFLNEKDYAAFKGEMNWLGEKIAVTFDVLIDNKGSLTKAMNVLRTLYEQQKQKDLEFRTFASEQLIDLANSTEWRKYREDEDEDEKTAIITPKDFMERISLYELWVKSSGFFVAVYHAGGMFWYSIAVSGNIRKGLKYATLYN